MSALSFEEHLVALLSTRKWPQAASPFMICDQNSVEDKRVRACGIFDLFIASKVDNIQQKKLLDFGCGEGLVVVKASNSGVKMAVGYDIAGSVKNIAQRLTFTNDFNDVMSLAPYDVILLYDVLDHVLNESPVEVLKKAKSVLSPQGTMIIRCHPWCSRHGTHLWSLNKMFAHVIFTEEQLEKLGHKGIPTLEITTPTITYKDWLSQAGLSIIKESTIHEPANQFFEDHPRIKERLMSRLLDYNVIEKTFYDFVCK